MRIGVMFPGDELSSDRDELVEWLDCAAECGFHHVVFGDHVVGVDPQFAPPGWNARFPGGASARAYTNKDVFLDPFVLFGYIAARYEFELVTGIMVLPQRQTVLVAKQAAEVDWLSGGRLRLGVSIGWNAAEYEALGVPVGHRAERFEEQIELLRQLWTQETVSFESPLHHLHGVGLLTLPIQRPIPIWLGGDSRVALERAGRIADGAFLPARTLPTAEVAETIAMMRAQASAAGRDPDGIGIEPRLIAGGLDDDAIRALVNAWKSIGASHLCIDTRFGGFEEMGAHLAVLRRVSELGL